MSRTAENWMRDNALAVLDSVVDAMIAIDVSGTIQFVNQATQQMFGYSDQELIGQPVSMLMPEPYRSQHQSFVDRYLATGDAQIIGIGRELTAVTKAGLQFPIYLAISEIRRSSDLFFTGIIRDLSEQKTAEATLLEQRDRLAHAGRLSTMGEMTASIAHEINQPLTAIAMYTQASIKMLQRPDFDHAKLITALDKLNQQSLRAGAVIERIQRFVRNEDGTKAFVDINELIRDLKLLVGADATLHGVRLDFDMGDSLPAVFCDRVQIQQVALNLIRNAIDAMEEVDYRFGSIVEVETRRLSRNLLQVSVSDTGTGVPMGQEERIFGAFHTTKESGMGMGLSICRSIIEAHGGTLNFQNNPGHGATFHFSLPIGERDEGVAQ